MLYLKADTAVTLKIGPFIDDTDGKTAETALTIAQADVRLSKNGGDIAQKNEATSCTHDELGVYGCPIDATDTNTEGRLQLWVHESGALPVFHEYMVVNANVYNSLFAAVGTDKLQTDVVELGGVAQSATDLKDFADAGYDPATNKVEGVKLADTSTAVTNDVGITQAGADKVWGTAARTLTSFGTLVQDIWDKLTSALTTVGSIGKLLVDDINATISSRAPESGGNVAAIKTAIEHGTYGLSALDTDLGTLLSRLSAARAGYLDELAAANIPADVDTLKTYCDILDHATNGLANIKTLIDTIDTVADAVKAKTDNLPADPADDSDIDAQLAAIAGYLDTEIAAILAAVDTEVAAIKAKTDNLPLASPRMWL